MSTSADDLLVLLFCYPPSDCLRTSISLPTASDSAMAWSLCSCDEGEQDETIEE